MIVVREAAASIRALVQYMRYRTTGHSLQRHKAISGVASGIGLATTVGSGDCSPHPSNYE